MRISSRITKTNYKINLKKKKKVHSSIIYNIWGTNFSDMQLIGKFNKEIRFYYVLCYIDILSKYVWVIKGIKVLKLLMLFKIIKMNLIANQTKYR